MPRKPRENHEGFYHIINRGVNKREVFLEDSDKKFFIKLMCEFLNDYDVDLYAYCLMDNHYHLLIENKKQNYSEAMRQINSKYAQHFNAKYERNGHLWQDRFKSYYILDDEHLFAVYKYIERNPIEAGVAKDLNTYDFSSFHELFGRQHTSCVQKLPVLDNFDQTQLQDVIKQSPPDTDQVFPTYPRGLLQKGTKSLRYYQIHYPLKEAVATALESGYSKKAVAQAYDLSTYEIGKLLTH